MHRTKHIVIAHPHRSLTLIAQIEKKRQQMPSRSHKNPVGNLSLIAVRNRVPKSASPKASLPLGFFIIHMLSRIMITSAFPSIIYFLLLSRFSSPARQTTRQPDDRVAMILTRRGTRQDFFLFLLSLLRVFQFFFFFNSLAGAVMGIKKRECFH